MATGRPRDVRKDDASGAGDAEGPTLAELHRLRALVEAHSGASTDAVYADLDRAEDVAREQGAALFLDRVRASRAGL